MNVTYNQIGDKKYPYYFGTTAIAQFLDEFPEMTGAIMGKGDDSPEFTITAMLKMAYYGLKSGHRKVGKPFDMTIEDIGDLMDIDADAFNKMISAKNE